MHTIKLDQLDLDLKYTMLNKTKEKLSEKVVR